MLYFALYFIYRGFIMSKNLKKMISYYKPYMGMFLADMFFAFLSAMIALSLPLVVRYVTSTLIYKSTDEILHGVLIIAATLFQCWLWTPTPSFLSVITDM